MADQDLITGNEPSLSRLWKQLDELIEEPPRALSQDERAELAHMRRSLRRLIRRVQVLEADLGHFVQTRFPKTGRTFRVRQQHTREHPEIVKSAICGTCGKVFTYQVYATGWTRRYCGDECRERHRTAYMRHYMRRRRAEGRQRKAGG